MIVKVRKVRARYLTAKWAAVGGSSKAWEWFNVDWFPF